MSTFDTLREIGQQALGGNIQAIFFWVASFVSIACVGSAVYQLRIRKWPMVKGVLLHADTEKFGATDFVAADQDYIIKLAYDYQVDGEQYRGTRLSPVVMTASGAGKAVLDYALSNLQQQDGKVDVFYNPRSPTKSFLQKPGIFSGLFTLFMGGGAVAVAMEMWRFFVG
jgi:hypothetical protein